jgi:Zn-dependent protease
MILLVMPVANSARGLVAKWNGDTSSDDEGRITLNPMAHIDPIGSLMILLIGFGWSNPMPIHFNRMKNPRIGVITVSLAGPVTYFLSAILCKILNNILFLISIDNENLMVAFSLVLSLLANINVCLGVINLLPLPPMDGFQVLNQLAGPKFHNWYYPNQHQINQISTIILFTLFFIGDLTRGIIDPLGWLISIVNMLLSIVAELPFMIFS